jgi:hypothetical protein
VAQGKLAMGVREVVEKTVAGAFQKSDGFDVGLGLARHLRDDGLRVRFVY